MSTVFSCRHLVYVEPKIQNSNSFLEDLRKINQLKDSSCQNDFSYEKPKAKGMKF